MVFHSLTKQQLTKIGIVTLAVAILGGVSFAIHGRQTATQTVRRPAIDLPVTTKEVKMSTSEQSNQDPVKIDQQHSEQTSGSGTVSSQTSSTVERHNGGTNVSVSNNSNQSASSNGGSASVSSSTSTNVNIQP